MCQCTQTIHSITRASTQGGHFALHLFFYSTVWVSTAASLYSYFPPYTSRKIVEEHAKLTSKPPPPLRPSLSPLLKVSENVRNGEARLLEDPFRSRTLELKPLSVESIYYKYYTIVYFVAGYFAQIFLMGLDGIYTDTLSSAFVCFLLPFLTVYFWDQRIRLFAIRFSNRLRDAGVMVRAGY